MSLHVHFVPVAIVEVATHRDDLRASAQVEAKTQGALHQLDLEEVVGAAVVGVEQQAVGLLGLELELEAAIGASSPFSKLGVGVRGAIQVEG